MYAYMHACVLYVFTYIYMIYSMKILTSFYNSHPTQPSHVSDSVLLPQSNSRIESTVTGWVAQTLHRCFFVPPYQSDRT